MAMIRVNRRVGNKTVSYLTPDKGKRGRTPVKSRWFNAGEGTLHGWKKTNSDAERHRSLLVSVNRDGVNSTKGKLVQLSNISADPETYRKARQDFEWLKRLYPPKVRR